MARNSRPERFLTPAEQHEFLGVLAEIRPLMGWTNETLADALGVEPSAYKNYMLTTRPLSMQTAHAILEAVGAPGRSPKNLRAGTRRWLSYKSAVGAGGKYLGQPRGWLERFRSLERVPAACIPRSAIDGLAEAISEEFAGGSRRTQMRERLRDSIRRYLRREAANMAIAWEGEAYEWISSVVVEGSSSIDHTRVKLADLGVTPTEFADVAALTIRRAARRSSTARLSP